MKLLKRIWLVALYSPLIIYKLVSLILFFEICIYVGHIPNRYREVKHLLSYKILSFYDFFSSLFSDLMMFVFLISIVFGIASLVRTILKKENKLSRYFLLHLLIAVLLFAWFFIYGFTATWFFC